MKPVRLTVLSACHFTVDFACAFFLLRCLRQGGNWQVALLWYNFCAFALQMPLGLAADRLRHGRLFGGAGCMLVACGAGLTGFEAVTALGVGNALFHIGGGVEVLYSTEDMGPLGIFVAPGAVGLALGLTLRRGGTWAGAAVAAALIACAAALLLGREPAGKSTLPEGDAGASPLGAAALLFSVVVLRSWAGIGASFPWKAGTLAIAAACAAALGKALGGALSDRLGPSKVTAWSLGAGAALFLLSHLWGAGLMALALFNMTMPVTLWAMARLMPGLRGFSFGLLTFALFLGFLPVYFGAPALDGPVLAAGSVFSLGLLLPGLRKAAGP
ncbi:hypothetical protein KQI82_01510 [Oscillibacter sp. MSJ-2]|uniref:MFS transporter n=1 Tax=Dysosmobacter acutus TaxID=2841504 RepID=A0ABS6F6E4_9FIRM|nr:hypothetical protein [Dysosmobacter acutus]MBU5625610.1 hypothetical protein [Dysosmobacter acutus]